MECSVFDTHKNETVGYAKFKFKPLRHVYLEKPPNKNNLLWITASHLHITASTKTVNGQHGHERHGHGSQQRSGQLK